MNNRQEKILNLLKKSNRKIAVNDLSKTFAVSKRTIFNDLNYLDDFLKSSGYTLFRDEDGILLKKVDPNKKQNIDINEFYSSNRKYDVLRNILFKNEKDIYNLSSKLFVSESTILSDINYINDRYLRSLSGKLLMDKDGIYIDGDEEIIQKVYVKYNELIFKKLRLMLIESKDLYRNYYTFLSDIYGKLLVTKIKNVLYSYLTSNSQVLAEYYFDNIINYLIVLVYRKLEDQSSEHFPSDKNSKAHNDDSKDILEMIEYNFGIKFSDSEIKYFSEILRANNIKNKINYDEIKIDNLVNMFLKSISEFLKIDLLQDEVLKEQLKKHIPSMIDRAKNNINIDNPFIDEIKNEYTTLFNTIWMVVIMNQNYFDFILNDDEIGLLTIYIQSSLDRNKTVQKILLHINNRYYDTEFIVNRIKKILPNIDIEVNEGELKEKYKNIDMIITTGDDINYGDIECVKISPIVTDRDLKNISEKYYSTIFKNANYKQINNKHYILEIIGKYFHPELTYFNKRFNEKSEIMNFALDTMIEEGIVTIEYKNSIFNRENMGSTALNYMISTPHGNPKYVNDSCIFTVINEKPINWDNEKVSLMFMININEKDILDLKTLFNFIYEISQDKALIDDLIKSKNYEEFIKIVRKEILWLRKSWYLWTRTSKIKTKYLNL